MSFKVNYLHFFRELFTIISPHSPALIVAIHAICVMGNLNMQFESSLMCA